MQAFTEAHQEAEGKFFVWYIDGKEIEAFRSESAVEAAIRRQFKGGWSADYFFDADGSFQFLGVPTAHTYNVETRNAITGV